MNKQPHPHLERLRHISRGQVRWFPAKINMIDDSLLAEGLIAFEERGSVVLTPAGLRVLYEKGTK